MEYLQRYIEEKCVMGGENIKITLLIKEFQTYLGENKLSTQKIKNKQFKAKFYELYPHIVIRKISVDHYIGITIRGYSENKTTRKAADRKRYLITKFFERELPDDIINSKDENGRKIYVRIGTYDKLYMLTDQLDPKNIDDKVYYFKLFKNKLISFIFNGDGTINWSETVNATHKAIEKYNEANPIKIERPIKTETVAKEAKRPIKNIRKNVGKKGASEMKNRRKNVGKEEVSDDESEDSEEVSNDESEEASDNEIKDHNQKQQTQEYKVIHGYSIPIYKAPPTNDRKHAKEYNEYNIILRVIARKVKKGKLTQDQKNEVMKEISIQKAEADRKWKRVQ